jgi:hypothetical protein
MGVGFGRRPFCWYNAVCQQRERRQVSEDAVTAIRTALEKAGVEFTNGKQPGVKLRRA